VDKKILKIYEEGGIVFPEDEQKKSAIEKTLIYLEEIDTWSSRISLISKGDRGHVLDRHFAESLQYAKGIKDISRLIDIGSGAGFPGIPLKIAFPEIHIVFAESQGKRARFLDSVLKKMNLSNYEVAFERAENLSSQKQYYQSFDAATFRSVASLQECLSLGAPFLKNEGLVLVKKEPEFDFQGQEPMFLSNELFFETSDKRKSKLMVFKKRST
jgi:16S rRNA (guanine527-N7)-methyltransferase